MQYDRIGTKEDGDRDQRRLRHWKLGSTVIRAVQATSPGACVGDTRIRDAVSINCVSRYVKTSGRQHLFSISDNQILLLLGPW